MYKTKEESKHKYTDMIRVLDEFFVPQVNPEYEKFIFANAKQSRSEPFDAFVNRLRLLANGCQFNEPESMIKSKIIQGCLSDQLRQRALSDKNMTLDRLIEEGRAMEASRLQAKQMEGGHEVVAAIDMELFIDTCSSMNVISESMYNSIKDKPKLRKVNCTVYGYQNPVPISFVGEFRAKIEYGNKLIEADVAVVKGNERCLIGFEAADRLGVVKIIDSLECKSIDFYKQKYPSVFSGRIGKLRGFKVKLDIDNVVEPVQIKRPRVPFNCLAKINDQMAKGKMKEYGDKKLKTSERNYGIGDLVYFHKPKILTNKLDTVRETIPYRVTETNGSMVTARSTATNESVTRNSSMFRRVEEQKKDDEASVVNGNETEHDKEPGIIDRKDTSADDDVGVGLRRSTRAKTETQHIQINPRLKTY
ncbi:RNA-directed DNA polymerase [Brachionus plicatilis]|uniref:RNA-directed DNA polymerase n=1 Tax=Brachionus plicatilis TaxID=10195 RepID=A0A3M7PP49_BRAPC|nr:RNA-directed DNA polymerase [Brachionus plicatilis]